MTINDLKKLLNRGILKSGIEGLGKAIKLNPGTINSINSRKIIESYYPKATCVFLDGKYRTISVEEWKEIDAEIYDITKKMWETEVWDCDDKAYTHKYWTLRIFGIPQMIVHGHLYDKTGKWVGGHFWNARISDDKLYFYEPDGAKWTEVEKGKKVFLGINEYQPLTFEF